MKLIDVTNSHHELVTKQLENTDAQSVRVYTLGPTTVIMTTAPTHQNIVVVNKSRTVRDREVNFVISKLFSDASQNDLEIITCHNFVEIERRM